jgi:hypothetical protein
MPARLSVYLPFRPARRFDLAEGHRYVVGRAADCELRLEDDRVSRHHAALRPGGRAEVPWLVDDLGSKNGTAVDGVAVEAGGALAHACWLSFGGLPARFELVGERDRLAGAERDRERRLAGRALEERLDPDLEPPELLARFLDSVLRLAAAERGFVLLARGDGDFEIAAAGGLGAADLVAAEFSGSGGAVERVLATGEAVVVSDAASDPVLGERASVVAGGIRALVGLPLRVQGRLLGVLYADSRRPGADFAELDLEILEALSAHAALALAAGRIDRELKRLAARLAAGPALGAGERDLLRWGIETAWERCLGQADEAPPTRAASTWRGIASVHAAAGGRRS